MTASKVDFGVEALLAEACAATGLSDFGEPDFREPLGVLCQTYERAPFDERGRRRNRRRVLQLLSSRLRVEDALRRHPEIREREIRRPMVLTGLPRSGTSALFSLLAADPVARPLLLWETQHPEPAEGLAPGQPDPRYQAVKAYYEEAHQKNPEFTKIHYASADTPEECVLLQALTLNGVHYGVEPMLEPYASWYRKQDLLPDVPLLPDAAPDARLAAARRALAAQGARAHVGDRRADRDLPGRLGRLEPPRPAALHRLDLQHDLRHHQRRAPDLEAGAGPAWCSTSTRPRWSAGSRCGTAATRLVLSTSRTTTSWRIRSGVARRIYAHFGLPLSKAAEAAMQAHVAREPAGQARQPRLRARGVGALGGRRPRALRVLHRALRPGRRRRVSDDPASKIDSAQAWSEFCELLKKAGDTDPATRPRPLELRPRRGPPVSAAPAARGLPVLWRADGSAASGLPGHARAGEDGPRQPRQLLPGGVDLGQVQLSHPRPPRQHPLPELRGPEPELRRQGPHHRRRRAPERRRDRGTPRTEASRSSPARSSSRATGCSSRPTPVRSCCDRPSCTGRRRCRSPSRSSVSTRRAPAAARPGPHARPADGRGDVHDRLRRLVRRLGAGHAKPRARERLPSAERRSASAGRRRPEHPDLAGALGAGAGRGAGDRGQRRRAATTGTSSSATSGPSPSTTSSAASTSTADRPALRRTARSSWWWRTATPAIPTGSTPPGTTTAPCACAGCAPIPIPSRAAA